MSPSLQNKMQLGVSTAYIPIPPPFPDPRRWGTVSAGPWMTSTVESRCIQISDHQQRMDASYARGVDDGYFSAMASNVTGETDDVDVEEDGLEFSRYWTERLAKTVMRMEAKQKKRR